MFKTAERSELSQISLTGMRAIVLMGLLIVAPRSLDEIRQAFYNFNLIEKDTSDDILRIDLNTLKVMGCEISRASKKTGFKYVLEKHPFSLTFNEEEIKILKKVYNYVKKNSSVDVLVSYDELFKKLSKHIYDNDLKEMILGVSVLKKYDIERIKEIIADCKDNLILKFSYKKPTVKEVSIKEVIALKLILKSDKLYLYGFDLDRNENIMLNFKRILEIIEKREHDKTIELKSVDVKFRLYDLRTDYLLENEHIVDETEEYKVVEGNYYNDFVAKQRILSLANKCVVTEPIEFRESIIEQLKEMSKLYD